MYTSLPVNDNSAADLPAGELPGVFVARLNEIVGAEEAARVLATMSHPKKQAYWHNPLRSADDLPDGAPVDGLPGMTVYSGSTPLSRHAAVVDGAAYPMNPASSYAALSLGAAPGMEVLDLAAAPGGKTLVLAGRMHDSGRLAAVEVVKGRFHRMRANLARCGVTNAAFYLDDGRRVGRKVPERFDRVLLDAPCSSESRFRVGEARTYGQWSERKLKETSRKQKGLLRSAYRALKPGGEMIYCTCAFAPEENEAVVSHFLRAAPEAEVLPLTPPCNHSVGLSDWRGREFDSRCRHAVRILPDDLWDGFFVCRFRKPNA